MHFDGRKKKNIVSSTRSTGNGLGFSTFNGVLGSRSSSPDFSRSFARQEINNYFSDDSALNMVGSPKFMLLSNMGSVQGEPEPSMSQIPRVNPGTGNINPSVLSTKDLEPRHRNPDYT